MSGPRTLAAIAEHVGGALHGDGSREIDGVAPLQVAGPRHLAFLDSARMAKLLASSEAGAVLVAEAPGTQDGPALIVVHNVRLALARALELFQEQVGWGEGVHPAAIVDPGAHVATDARVAAGVVIGAGCSVGARTRIDPGVVLYPGVTVGEDCFIQARCVMREGTRVGDRVILQPGVVLGGDGFGYAQTPEHSHYKIPQLGIVIIEDDVEIGANSCIDRATMGATHIARGTKIDNLVQIGHNCAVGEHVIVCGQVGVAGSTTIEHHVMVGGQAGLAGHMTVGAGAQVGAQSGASHDIPPGARVVGTPVMDGRDFARLSAANPRLAGTLGRLRKLERAVFGEDAAGRASE